MDQIFTASREQLARSTHGPDVMLFEYRGGFVQSMLEHLDGLQLSEIPRPLILPVER